MTMNTRTSTTAEEIEEIVLTMPPAETLYSLAVRLDRRARELTKVVGSNSDAEHLEFVRNLVLIANTDAEREGLKRY